MSTRGSERAQKKGAVDVNWRHDEGKNVGMGRQLTEFKAEMGKSTLMDLEFGPV